MVEVLRETLGGREFVLAGPARGKVVTNDPTPQVERLEE